MKKSTAMFLAVLVAVVVVFSGVLSACTPNAPHTPSDDSTSKPDGSKPEHVHKLTHIAAVTESCESDGMREHWVCESCGKCFSDGDATKETDADSLVIAAHHTLTHHSEQKATCTADGNVDYYQCAACEKTFLDEAGKNEIALDEVAIAAKGHIVGDEWQHDENGHWKICAACGEKVDYADHNYKDYVCQACGTVDEKNRPLDKTEKTQKIMDMTKSCVQNTLGKSAIINSYITIDFKVENDENNLYVLVDNKHLLANGVLENFLSFYKIRLNTVLNDDTIKNNSVYSTDKYAKWITSFPKTKQDELITQILSKLSIDEKFDYVGFANRGGGFFVELGDTAAGIYLYMINELHIQSIILHIGTKFGTVTDTNKLIEKQFLQGTLGKDYTINDPENPIKTEYEFSDNAIFNFEPLRSLTDAN